MDILNLDALWNYELGAKTAWLQNSLTINASVYYIDWSNVQQLVALPADSTSPATLAKP